MNTQQFATPKHASPVVQTLATLVAVVAMLALGAKPATAAAQAQVQGQPDTTFGGGTLEVGKDVAPGTYQTQVPANSFGCYWARLSDLSGDFDAILANANLESGDMATVTINAGDVGFESSRCGTWKPSGQVGPANPAATMGGGTWIVSEDIKPGSYRTTVPSDSTGCYWARLSDLSGGLNSILANDNIEPGDRVTVTVGSGDKGFTSNRCGTWEMAGQ
ncbi:MAG TPA: hypothetical protein VF062_25115 [Candidatus Limnocylindrales bacterium]